MDYELTANEICIYEALIRLSETTRRIDLDVLRDEIDNADFTDYDIRSGIVSMRNKGVFEYDPDASLVDWV